MKDQFELENGVLVPAAKLAVTGRYDGQIIRNGEVIEEFTEYNLVANEGLNSILNIHFNSASQITAWYMGVFEGNYTPTAGVTAATVASTSTESTAYTNSTRPSFTTVSSTAQSVTNSASRASFVFNAAKTIYGAFVVSNNTKSGTSGSLFSIARFATARSVDNGDELLLTYTFNIASV